MLLDLPCSMPGHLVPDTASFCGGEYLTMIKNVDFAIRTFHLLNTKLETFLARLLCPLCMIYLCCKALGKTSCYLGFEENGCAILAGKEFLLYVLALLCIMK